MLHSKSPRSSPTLYFILFYFNKSPPVVALASATMATNNSGLPCNYGSTETCAIAAKTKSLVPFADSRLDAILVRLHVIADEALSPSLAKLHSEKC